MRGQRHEHDRAQHAAEEGRPDADAERQPRLTLARHEEAVECRGHRGRRTGNAGEDAGHEATRQSADEHADHGGESLRSRHAEGERQSQHHRHGDGEAGDRAGDQAARAAQHHQRNRLDVGNFGECQPDIIQDHGGPLSRTD